MRMRSRSVAAAPPSLAVTVGGNTGASRSLLNLPGELKVHYSEVVNVAEKLTRLFSRSHSYNVHKHHKTLVLPKKKVRAKKDLRLASPPPPLCEGCVRE